MIYDVISGRRQAPNIRISPPIKSNAKSRCRRYDVIIGILMPESTPSASNQLPVTIYDASSADPHAPNT